MDVALQPCQVLFIRLRNRPYTTAGPKPLLKTAAKPSPRNDWRFT